MKVEQLLNSLQSGLMRGEIEPPDTPGTPCTVTHEPLGTMAIGASGVGRVNSNGRISCVALAFITHIPSSSQCMFLTKGTPFERYTK